MDERDRSSVVAGEVRAGSGDLRKHEGLPSIEVQERVERLHPTQELMYNCDDLEIIDSILPPRDWTDHNNKLHIQYVSHQPSSREDVLELITNLDRMLADRQAKKTGICPIRE